MSFCTNCGTQLKDENQKFCKNRASPNQRQEIRHSDEDKRR